MADTSGCCNGPRGRHLPGCDGNRQKQKLKAANDRAEASFAEKALQFIAKHPHGSPHYTPNPFPGVTCENRPDRNGRYHYILRK